MALSLLAACGGSGTPTRSDGVGGAVALPLERASEHFVLHYSDASGALAGPYGSALEESWPRMAIPLAPDVAVHEFAHNVTLALNPAVADNPVWLWESVAVFESGQLVAPQSVPCLASGPFPKLADVNRRDGPCSVYAVGYTIGEFVVDGWGFEGLRALIIANGDVTRAFGLTVAAFEEGWKRFVETRYLAVAGFRVDGVSGREGEHRR